MIIVVLLLMVVLTVVDIVVTCPLEVGVGWKYFIVIIILWWPALTEAGLGEDEEVQRVQDVAEPDRDHEHVASLIVNITRIANAVQVTIWL